MSSPKVITIPVGPREEDPLTQDVRHLTEKFRAYPDLFENIYLIALHARDLLPMSRMK